MTTFEKIEKKYNIDFSDFDSIKDRYYKNCNVVNNPSFSKENAEAAFNALREKLIEILDVCAKESGIDEEASFYTSELKDIIPKVTFALEKSSLDFTIGLFRDFYIVTEIKYPNNLRYMKDDFWINLIKMTGLGKFKFSEKDVNLNDLRKKHPNLFNKQGNFYKLIRNYFINQTEYGRTQELGFLSINWDSDIPAYNLLEKYIEAFNSMYKMNKLLYEAEKKYGK